MKNRICPKCRELGHDSKGDHLFLMSDGATWGCFKSYHPPYFEREGEKVSPIKLTAHDIRRLPIVENKDRCISTEVMDKFRVRTEFNETTGEPSIIYYPETTGGQLMGYKARRLPKSFSVLYKGGFGNSNTPDLFGQHCCPRTGQKLLICAGEEDTLAAYQMLHSKYPEWDLAVVGLPRGEETSVNVVAEHLSFLSGFKEVIIATDMDEAGRKALGKLVAVVGESSRTIDLSEKDISDMLVKGKQKEFINAYFNCKEYRPASIVQVSDILEEAIAPVRWGLDYPFQTLTKLTYGMKQVGEIIGIGAGPGIGKSTLFQQIQKHLVFYHRQQIAIFDIEEGPIIGMKKLIGSEMRIPIHLPDCEYDIAEARRIGKQFEGLTHFYGGDSENWAEVEDSIRYFASKGVKFFFIDPLSALVEHLSASEANTELGKIMRAMRKFRKHQGLTFFHANHLNNPTSGKDHGEGGAVRGGQFSGSRAQWKYSTLLLGLEGNQLAEEEGEKHLRRLVVIKDRLGGNTGYVDLKYNPKTGVLEEPIFEERF